MSIFTQRLNSIGEFEIGQGKFVVLDVKGGLVRVVQTHSVVSGSILPSFETSTNGGVVSTSTTAIPVGFIVPQTHSAFNAIKSQIADLDSRQLMICPQCDAAGVTLQNFANACDSCIGNMNTISDLKSMV